MAMEKPDEGQRENTGGNQGRKTPSPDKTGGKKTGYARLSAGINLGWIRLEGPALTLAASWPLEAPLSLHISPQGTDTPSNWAEKCQDRRMCRSVELWKRALQFGTPLYEECDLR